MKNNTLNFITYFNIGSLNEKKIKAILDKCSNKYVHAEVLANNNSLLISNVDNTKQIQVFPNQITINRVNFEDFQNEIQDIQQDIAMIIDALMLEDITNSAVLTITDIQPFNDNTMEFTKSFVPNVLRSSFNENLLGSGFRFFLKGENGLLNEFKIEPLVSNNNYLFIQGIYNYMNLNCKNLISTLNKNTIDFNNKLNDILSNIIK